MAKFGDALEDIFRRVRREIGNELVVNRQVGRHDEKIIDAVREVQVADECAHEPGFADAGGQRETERGNSRSKSVTVGNSCG